VALAAIFVLFCVWFVGSSPAVQEWMQYQAQKAYVIGIEAEQRNDVYGGFTPEETMALFIAALKKGDTELAVKYVDPESRDEARNLLVARMGGAKTIDAELIERLENAELSMYGELASFDVVTVDGSTSSLMMIKSSISKRWKLSEL